MLFKEINKIITNKNILNVEYRPKKIIGRNKEIKNLAFNLSYFLGDYPSLPKLIVYGSTGTGKTTVINYVLDEFLKEVKKEDKRIKIIKIKGSDSRTKYEIIKQIVCQIEPSAKISRNTSEMRDKLIDMLKEKGLNLLIFIDEIHGVMDSELNGILYFISRLGEDLNFYGNNKPNLLGKSEAFVGYILVSNEMNLVDGKRIQENTKSSMTKERLIFSRYSPEEVYEILVNRIDEGAIAKDSISEEALQKISTFSVKEGEDSRYAILLLSKACRYAEEKGLGKIDIEVVDKVNAELKKNLIKELIRDCPPLYCKVLAIMYLLHESDTKINSKIIYDCYIKNPLNSPIQYSRISQIVTDLEKDNIIYVISKRNNRTLSIKETSEEIKSVLTEKGYL